MTSLEHPELPARVLEEPMEWIQPTPTLYVLVEPLQIMEVTSSEEDPKEDPVKEPEVQQLEPEAEMLPASEEEVEPIAELDLMEEVGPEPVVESVEESGLGCLVESNESLSQDYRLKWMAPAYSSQYPRSSTIPTLLPVVEVISSQSSSEFAVLPDIDRPGPSCATRVVISSDSSLKVDPNSPCFPNSPPSQMDQ